MSGRHHSHQSGRDVDVFYFGADDRGRPLPSIDAMVPYSADGRSRRWRQDGLWRIAWGRHFDDARNWAMVRAFLSDPGIEVQWIFGHQDLIERMLLHAAERREDPALVARAAAVMLHPAGSLPHDDHLHIRVYCDPADRAFGCVDTGPSRWVKKHAKFTGSRALALLDGAGAPPSAAVRVAAVLPPALRWIALSPMGPIAGRW